MPRRYIDKLPDDIQEAVDIIIYEDLLDDVDWDLEKEGRGGGGVCRGEYTSTSTHNNSNFRTHL